MKRPVFWAVVMFALGEVAGLFVRTWKQLGIAFAMLLCVAGICLMLGRKLQVKCRCFLRVGVLTFFYAGILTFLLPVGCLFSAFRSGNYHYYSYAQKQKASFGCDLSYMMPELPEKTQVTVYGKVKNISVSSDMTVLTVKVLECSLTAEVAETKSLGPYVTVNITEKTEAARKQGGVDLSKVAGMQGGADVPETAGMQGGGDLSKVAGKQGEADVSEPAGMQGGADVPKTAGMQGEADVPETSGMQGEACVQNTYKIGDCIIVTGTISLIEAAENPGQFDMQKYYLSRRIRYKIYAEKLQIAQRNYSMKQQLMDARAYLKSYLHSYADEETAAFYCGILLGDKSELSKNTRRLFECAGISHILAISALHISLIAMTWYKLLRRCGIHFIIACPCAGVLVFLYGTLTGWSFSAVRAAIMLGLVFLGELLGRKVDLLTSASIALLAMSITNPYLLLDSGVCLGFFAVVGIAIGQVYNRAFMKYYKQKYRGGPQNSCGNSIIKSLRQGLFLKFIQALITGTFLFIFTAPIVARVYYSVSTYSILINLFVVPFMTIIVILGLLGLLFACLHVPFAGVLLQMGGRCLTLIQAICRFVIQLPIASIQTGKITIPEIVIYFVFVAGLLGVLSKSFREMVCKSIHKLTYKWLSRQSYRRLLFVFCIFYFVFSGSTLTFIRKGMLKEEIVFLAVGQGDGILIRTDGGCNIVVDGGSSSIDKLGENILMPAIKAKSMHHINYWFISHADKDHISGLEAILEAGELSQIDIDYIVVAKAAIQDENTQMLLSKATDRNIEILYMEQGNKLVGTSDFEITCVGPAKTKLSDSGENYGSISGRDVIADDKAVGKTVGKTEEKTEEKPEEKTEKKTEGRTEEKTEEKTEKKTVGKTEEKTVGKTEEKAEEKTVGKTEEKAEEKTVGKTEGRNDNSLCFTYESKNLFALFTGDAGTEEMIQIAEALRDKFMQNRQKQTILKVPHHGSKYSYVEDLYWRFDVAVISCGRNNFYGHPHKEILDRLNAEGTFIYRTDELGAIMIQGN